MKTLKVPKKKAEKIRQDLLDKNLLEKYYEIKADKNYVYLPVKDTTDYDFEMVDLELSKVEENNSFISILEEELSEDELLMAPKGFDIIGSIAIVEFNDFEKKEIFGKAVIASNKNIKTVLEKAGVHSGEFRTQKLDYVCGEETKETIHKENNALIKLNVEKVYFSPRLSTERKRISELVKNNEKILVMFSGCGPYPLVIAKNASPEHITGVELNPVAHKYGQENIRINKLDNITLIKGDVRKVVPDLGQFDRIVMPLPKTGEDFLGIAFGASKSGTVIHFYDFAEDPDISAEKVKKECVKHNIKCKILNKVICGDYSPGIHRVCVDFQII